MSKPIKPDYIFPPGRYEALASQARATAPEVLVVACDTTLEELDSSESNTRLAMASGILAVSGSATVYLAIKDPPKDALEAELSLSPIVGIGITTAGLIGLAASVVRLRIRKKVYRDTEAQLRAVRGVALAQTAT